MNLPRPALPFPRSDYTKNLPLLNIFAALKMALFPMAIITLFWKEQIGLTLTEIFLLQAIFSFATLFMEFPSGYLSDRLGYRFALSFASLIGIIGWATYTAASTFTGVLIAELLLGASYAFISGADSALLFETLKQNGAENTYARHDGRMTAWAQIGEATGALGAGVLYLWMPLLPFFLQIIVWVAALAICRNLKETPSHTTQSGPHLQQALAIANKAFLASRGLRFTIILAVLLGLSSFYPVWLIQPYMQSLNVPLHWFGPIWAAANLSVSLGSVLSHRIQFHLGIKGTTLLLLALVFCGYAGLWITHALWSFAFYFLLTIMRGIQGPFLRAAIQQQIEREERASVLSLKSLSFRLGFIMTGPLIGMTADRFGYNTCFLVLMVALTVFTALIVKPFLNNIPDTKEH